MAVYNERGVIAESYHDLQGLGVLHAARRRMTLSPASSSSTLRTVLQAVEIGLLNLADLMGRAAADVEQSRPGGSLVKLQWARGFHRVLVRLSVMPQQLILGCPPGRGTHLSVVESPAYREYATALARFDQAVISRVRCNSLRLDRLLGERSLDEPELQMLHLARIGSHEATIWERNLANLASELEIGSYAEFVAADAMREAVYERRLAGDTYFTQFRGLHQIPETLSEELNDHLEVAVRHLRAGSVQAALHHLVCANVLSEGVLASVPPIADGLTTADYHEIRENLGLTSGSHSVSLRYHLFTHLYEQLCEAALELLTGGGEASGEMLGAAAESLRRARPDDGAANQVRVLLEQCLSLRSFIFQWRALHLHLPRNNLGGSATKSLTGSPDAVKAVERMQDTAWSRDPLRPLIQALQLASREDLQPAGQLGTYIASSRSLDSAILEATGRVSQRRFTDVQERLGYFSTRVQFTPPPRRTV
jgi:hypothetical protein